MRFNNLRYFFAKIFYAGSYLDSVNDFFNQKILGHTKIIGWWRGRPVYSSFLVPGLSKPLGNLVSQYLVKMMGEENFPGIMNIGVIDKCNCNCNHCSFKGSMDKESSKDLLTLEDFKKIIDQSLDLGATVINFVGGEPLLNKDLPKIIEYINKDKAVSSVFTNGWFLKNKAKELKKAGLMQVNVSLDFVTPKEHDDFRGIRGTFAKVIEGIKECQKVGLLTAISTTVTQEKLKNGEFEKMIFLAKKLKVNEVVVLDMMDSGMYSHMYSKDKPINKKRLYEIVDKYNKRKDFPGIFCYSRLRDVFGCCAGRNYFYVSPFGNIHPCDFTSEIHGNIKKTPLKAIWKKLSIERKGVGCFKGSCGCV
jgi:MoaA/NifB/PqqE/SkfB family radical SAM enzyme